MASSGLKHSTRLWLILSALASQSLRAENALQPPVESWTSKTAGGFGGVEASAELIGVHEWRPSDDSAMIRLSHVWGRDASAKTPSKGSGRAIEAGGGRQARRGSAPP